jgi:hypothetical protein
MEEYYIMNRITADDGYGGYKSIWQEGATIKAAIDVPDSSISTVADALTERINCKVITSRDITLQYNDYLKRKRDGRYFHILQDGTDMSTPASASLDMRVCKAEVISVLPE